MIMGQSHDQEESAVSPLLLSASHFIDYLLRRFSILTKHFIDICWILRRETNYPKRRDSLHPQCCKTLTTTGQNAGNSWPHSHHHHPRCDETQMATRSTDWTTADHISKNQAMIFGGTDFLRATRKLRVVLEVGPGP